MLHGGSLQIDYGFKILVLINMLLVRHHELLIGGGQLLTGPAVGATGGTGGGTVQ